LVNTNAGPQRREVYQNPNFQTQRLLVENLYVHELSKFNIQQSAFGSLHKNILVKRPETILLTQPVASSSTEATKQVGKKRQKTPAKKTKP
jgi:hypothetical protein